jgi:VWFA-related protein
VSSFRPTASRSSSINNDRQRISGLARSFVTSLALVIAAVSLVVGQNSSSPAQNPPSKVASAAANQQPAATFHAETRLVVIDVVVTKHGHPVLGLTKSDFMVLEDNKPEQIQAFEAHVPPVQPAKPIELHLPPHEYTNFPTRAPGSTINIILFDLLNTPITDQPYARWEMVRFLKTLPPGQQIALFALGTKLRMIAGFDTTSEELVAASAKLTPQAAGPLETEAERQQEEDQIALMQRGFPGSPAFFSLMRDFIAEGETNRAIDLGSTTLNAFNQLAAAVSGYPGRKNIIWLSEGFPVFFGPELNFEDPEHSVRTFTDVMRETAGILSSSQISVYPVDVRGLSIGGVDIASNGAGIAGFSHGTTLYGSLLSRQRLALYNSHDNMDEIAEETGGKAYYDTNDLKFAMQESVENGSHYYTIAYVPQNQTWDSRYRRIKIKLRLPGMKAEYRRGYFAVKNPQSSEQEAHAAIIGAMQPTVPQATTLLLHARVLPPDVQNRKVRIDCSVYAPDLLFTDGPESRKLAALEFIAVAWDKDRKAAANASERLELALAPKEYEMLLKNGIPAHAELQLNPGTYTLRLGVMDDGSKKIGTLDVPLQISDNSVAPAR